MMPKKRSLSDNYENEDDHSAVVEDVENNLKNAREDDDENEEEGVIPFLDTFYGLSSSSASERAQAAQALLEHCLFGPNANFKDAAYALKRLFNGLCSGRASSRQGYASALTSFLKIAFQKGIIDDIQRAYVGENEELSAPAVFVRNGLLATTDPNKTETGKFGKRKGSEERDYFFGRIFGILSVLRSGTLSMNVSGGESAFEVEDVAVGYANDLVDLFHTRKWMREPATQGILTLLGCFSPNDNEATKSVVDEVVTQVLIPKLLLGIKGDQERPKLLRQYSPEQIAVAVQIQSTYQNHKLPFPLDEAVLSSENLNYLSDALASTSSVVHPRTHLVWDVLWSSLTEDAATQGDKGSRRKKSHARVLCQNAPACTDSAHDVVAELFRTVVVKSLLGIHSQEDVNTSNTTHERRALALTLVKMLCGGEYVSSTMGTITLVLDLDLLENVILSSVVVKRLFFDVICAGVKTNSQQRHMLKPLALHVLESIVPSVEDEHSWERRLAFARAILSCDPRFDTLTRFPIVSNLLLLGEAPTAGAANAFHFKMWTDYLAYLKLHILSLEGDDGKKQKGKTTTLYDASGYVDLMYNTLKYILRVQPQEENDNLEEFKRTTIQDALFFLMASAFFDCSNLSAQTTTRKITDNCKKKKKMKASKHRNGDGDLHSAVKEGLFVQKVLVSDASETSETAAVVPYSSRRTLSSRFYSLLAEYMSMAVPRRMPMSEAADSGSSPSFSNIDKDAKIVEIFASTCEAWNCLVEAGATPFPSGDEVEQGEAEKVKILVRDFQSQATSLAQHSRDRDSKETSKLKCIFGATKLVSILYLHLLHCGKPDHLADAGDDPMLGEDDDHDEDDAEIFELISDLSEVTQNLLGEDHREEEEGNALAGLAELCVGILSSPLCSGSQIRGAASKIVRESVRSAWIGGLNIAVAKDSSEEEVPTYFNKEVVSVLLNAVGASVENVDAEEELNESDVEMDDDDDSEDENTSGESDRNDTIFSATAAKALSIDSDDDVDLDRTAEEKDEVDAGNSEDDDVELDHSQLQSLLLEDSDADMSVGSDGELEHHAGADAALAQLIKLKQDARKAGKQAREKLEISNRLRCLVLIEALVVTLNSTDAATASSNAVGAEVALQLLIPLIQERRSLEKSVSTSSDLGKKGSSAENEKRALIDRLTTLLKSKICKLRMVYFSNDVTEGTAAYLSDLTSRIFTEARRGSEVGHTSCCSAALIMSLRSFPKSEDMVASASVYNDAVKEWSSRRTTRLSSSIFEDLIQQSPSLAQVVLTEPLALATVEARSPFLKSEAFRLLAIDYATAKSLPATKGSIEKMGTEALKKAAPIVAKNANEALQSSDMQKTKRVRDVLKAVDKVIPFAALARVQLRSLRQCLDTLKDGTESHGIRNTCERLSNEITTFLSGVESVDNMDVDKESAVPKGTPKKKSSGGKKKRKKKGKKK